jgi:hypothetical protein
VNAVDVLALTGFVCGAVLVAWGLVEWWKGER